MDKINEELPLVSIVLNTRNRARLLPRSITSALNQTYSNFELIVVDGDSSDETKDVVENFMKKDKRVKYLYIEENKCGAYCINRGFEFAKGKFIAILDDDDEFLPEKLEKQINIFKSGPDDLGIVYCWEQFIDDRTGEFLRVGKEISRGNLYNQLLEGPCTGGGTLMLIKKEAIDTIGGYDDSIKFGSDYQFNLNISKRYMHDFVPEILVKTHWNHEYLLLTTQPGANIDYISVIEYYEKILSDHNYSYNLYPDKCVGHYQSIISAAYKAKKLNIVLKYVKKTMQSKMNYRNKSAVFKKVVFQFVKYLIKR